MLFETLGPYLAGLAGAAFGIWMFVVVSNGLGSWFRKLGWIKNRVVAFLLGAVAYLLLASAVFGGVICLLFWLSGRWR